MTLLKCSDQSLKVSSQSVAERLKKTKFCPLMYLADQSNGKAYLELNIGKLAQSFGLNLCHHLAMITYNNVWAGRRNGNFVLNEFDRSQKCMFSRPITRAGVGACLYTCGTRRPGCGLRLVCAVAHAGVRAVSAGVYSLWQVSD